MKVLTEFTKAAEVSFQAIMMVRFVKEYCNDLKYLLSTDDDVIINLWEVIKTLKLYSAAGNLKKDFERTIFCCVHYHARVVRDPKNKW